MRSCQATGTQLEFYATTRTRMGAAQRTGNPSRGLDNSRKRVRARLLGLLASRRQRNRWLEIRAIRPAGDIIPARGSLFVPVVNIARCERARRERAFADAIRTRPTFGDFEDESADGKRRDRWIVYAYIRAENRPPKAGVALMRRAAARSSSARCHGVDDK